MNKETVKNVVITEVRLKELLKMEYELDYLYKHHEKVMCDVEHKFDIDFKKGIQKIMNTNYSDKELSK